MVANNFEERLRSHMKDFSPVVPLNTNDVLLLMDFTEQNKALNDDILNDTNRFMRYVNAKLDNNGARYGVGGYNEHRTIYSRSRVFDGKENEEPRRLHLGIDIWGRPYTKVMAPMNGIVHSFAFNNGYGDYGATIILTHQLDGITFHTLYGHLSLNSLRNLQEGQMVRKGDVFSEFGIPFENGQWPPHLHFQLVIDMEGRKGDYPGVCKYSERELYLQNCPNPDLILQIMYRAKPLL